VKFDPIYNGHDINARKALIKLGLANKEDLAYLSDREVQKLINESNYYVFRYGEDFVLIPKELENQLVWICR
jgi:hypothetical protein